MVTRANLEAAGQRIGDETGQFSLDSASWEAWNTAHRGDNKAPKAASPVAPTAKAVKQASPWALPKPWTPPAASEPDDHVETKDPHEMFARLGLTPDQEKLVMAVSADVVAASFATPGDDPVGSDNETLAILDPATLERVNGIVGGAEHDVRIPGHIVQELAGTARPVTLVHTHPSSISLSLNDIHHIVVSPLVAIETIVAVGRDGSMYAAKAKPDMTAVQRDAVMTEVLHQVKAAEQVARDRAIQYVRKKLGLGATEVMEFAEEIQDEFVKVLAVVRSQALRRAAKNIEKNVGAGLFSYEEYVPERRRAIRAQKAAEVAQANVDGPRSRQWVTR